MSCRAEVDAAIRSSGLRRTLPRSLVLSAVKHSGGHSSASQVAERLAADFPEAGIAFSTVYRTLELLEARGVLSALRSPSSETRYEWAAGEASHHHLVCRECGSTAELAPDTLHELSRQIEDRTGFRPALRHLALDGLCAACRSDAPSDAESEVR